MKITQETIIKALADGKRPEEIAKDVKKSKRTIEDYIAKLRFSYEAKTNCQLIAMALRNKVIS